jgi:serine/threonine protein phosphatase PrpC
MQSNMTQETHDQDSMFNMGKGCSVSIIEMQSGPSKQDIVRTGTRSDGSRWIMVADGHGNNTVTDALRGQNWDEVMNMEDHFQYIEQMVKDLGDTSGSGATMSTVIMAPDGFHCKWRGDSTIKIFENGTEVFSAMPHNQTHDEEAKRMSSNVVPDNKSFAINVLSPTELTMDPSNYYVVGTKKNRWGQEMSDNMAMTNALGHNGGSGGVAEEAFIPKTAGAEYSVVVATDGLWDMMCEEDTDILTTSTATELADIATARWGQEWDYTYPNPRVYRGTDQEHTIQTSKQIMGKGQMDDIGVAVWREGVRE